MLALVTTPGEAGSTHVTHVPAPRPDPGQVLVRTLEVGVCGTDREIAEGRFGVAPAASSRLVLGHELLGVVERDGPGGFTRGDLVTATVRRSCEHCAACAEDAPDACRTGDYAERGITALDGFARELVAEDAAHLVPVPAALREVGVLAEPASICARGLRHAAAVAARQPWAPTHALVLGTGAIGMLATCFLRLQGLAVWTVGRAPRTSGKAQLVEGMGARYACSAESAPAALAAEVGGFDVVLEAAGDAQLMLDALGLLARNGVACLLGIDGRPQELRLDGRVIGIDAVLQNRALIGSVNANRVDWEAAVGLLGRARTRWPGHLEAFVGLRVAPEDFADAFAFGGVKATLRF